MHCSRQSLVLCRNRVALVCLAAAVVVLAASRFPVRSSGNVPAAQALESVVLPAQGSCGFTLGFAALRTLVGTETIGECLEDEHFNPGNGNAEQRTARGLLVWRKADNWTAFTDGYVTWVNGPLGVQRRLNTQRFDWEGDAGASGTEVIDASPAPGAQPAVTVLAAGDVAGCAPAQRAGADATARLLDTHPGAVLVLGDAAYDSGTADEFQRCYAPTWGRHVERTYPAPGNHEYLTPGAAGYFAYFGAAAGEAGRGYYSYRLGDWLVVSLNSNCAAVGGCGAGSTQDRWLRATLAANPVRCTLAYMHHPRFSSGEHGGDVTLEPLWRALYDGGADLVLAGHDHNYERFAPQTPSGQADPQRGLRSFVVGTGGVGTRAIPRQVPNSEVRRTGTLGVLKLTLAAAGYDWDFIPVAGQTFRDTGSASCH
ncbi:MAG: hypothetical protein AVDCRST_MAG77-264 [uncultured Chloroflexi bacterium]|uniref:Calcineurin-like phosphoesterase domain-containing protein n=1 Tax=uncultured Chloroflexota bacterium TaxID=166587 RepID=A0A6J4H491_9CHLR|nr:MAG: hypothetical protein AVDCRST_MAG77-264 [uncultured Chloroflexota bacterium]